MIKRYGKTTKAAEPRLVSNCKFFQVVFYSKYKDSMKIKQEKVRLFFNVFAITRYKRKLRNLYQALVFACGTGTDLDPDGQFTSIPGYCSHSPHPHPLLKSPSSPRSLNTSISENLDL